MGYPNIWGQSRSLWGLPGSKNPAQPGQGQRGLWDGWRALSCRGDAPGSHRGDATATPPRRGTPLTLLGTAASTATAWRVLSSITRYM